MSQDCSLSDALCRANTGLPNPQPCSLSACWRERWRNKGINSCPNAYERTCRHSHRMSEWLGSGGDGNGGAAVVGFQFLVITSLFSENLMCFCNLHFLTLWLGTCLKETVGLFFPLNFFCLWRILLLEHSAHLWLKEQKVWLPCWRVAPCCLFFYDLRAVPGLTSIWNGSSVLLAALRLWGSPGSNLGGGVFLHWLSVKSPVLCFRLKTAFVLFVFLFVYFCSQMF